MFSVALLRDNVTALEDRPSTAAAAAAAGMDDLNSMNTASPVRDSRE